MADVDKSLPMSCRLGCGACCVAPSISSPIPAMPRGKPAGVRCIQLDDQNLFRLFDQPERPSVCLNFKADSAVCGESASQAMELIAWLESDTA